MQVKPSPSSPPHPPPRDDSSNYLEILASNTPLLDVRAPIEYVKGSFPNTRNIPLLNDHHRELIGTCYKEKGQDAAIALGQTLVNDDKDDDGTGGLKSELVQAWKDHIELHPNGYLFCFRGGLRSRIVQQWLQEAGIQYPFIIGGYKAMRSSLLLDLEVSLKSLPMVLVGGRTCSGKTIALMQLSRYIDLEGLANHRGSAFGAVGRGDQPSQIDFENSIIIEFNKHRQSSSTLPVFMEDEGHRIGDRTLPIPMHRPMADDFPLVILETPMQERVDICIQEYVQDPFLVFLAVEQHKCNSGSDSDNDDGIDSEGNAHARIRDTFLDAVRRIRKGLQKAEAKRQKRLGGTPNTNNRGNEILGEFESAFDLFESSNATNVSGFRKPIQSLLEDYYDPMYDYQMSKRQGEILFNGGMVELVNFAEDYRATSTK